MTATAQPTAENIYELASFAYKENIPFETQLASTERLNEIVAKAPGFRSRQFYYSEDNKMWFDFVVWESEEAAKAALESLNQAPEAMEIFSLMNDEVTMISHYKKFGGVVSTN